MEIHYCGHQSECPEVPLTCLNGCGANKIKLKDMESHRSKCPKEPVRCPFAETGCNIAVHRHQLAGHMTSNQQQHLLMVMKDNKKMNTELVQVKIELHKMKRKLFEAEAKLAKAEDRIACSSRLQKAGDFIRVHMPKFSEFRCSGKVWCSPPFYYGEGYKMCLGVYANGAGSGAGSHVSVGMYHGMGEYDDNLKWPLKCSHTHKSPRTGQEGYYRFFVCSLRHRLAANQLVQIGIHDKFYSRAILNLENDCLSFSIEFDDCHLVVRKL